MTTPQVTTDHYNSRNHLTEIDEPASQGGAVVTFGYDANGNRDQKTVTTGGSNPTTTQVNDTYQNGRLAYQTNGSDTLLATFTYDPSGVPESVVVGTDPVNGPRDYYVYNGHGDVVALTDASGNVVASYRYDVWGNLISSSESFANGWTNPYRYDGKDGARYDPETGLYWLSTRAYDPTLGRFLQRDPLGRAPLYFSDQPYAYAGNNPLVNTDPSGELIYREGISAAQQVEAARTVRRVTRVQTRPGATRHPAVPQFDANGKCITFTSCDAARAKAAANAQNERDKDLAIATILGIVLDALRMVVDKSDVAREITDSINLMSVIGNGIGLVASWLFGASSWVTHAAQLLAATANKVLGLLRAVQGLEGLWWAAALLEGALVGAQAAEGGLAPIIGVVTSLIGEAIINGASVFIYVFAQRSQNAALLADALGSETTQQYCRTTPGACGRNIDWSA